MIICIDHQQCRRQARAVLHTSTNTLLSPTASTSTSVGTSSSKGNPTCAFGLSDCPENSLFWPVKNCCRYLSLSLSHTHTHIHTHIHACIHSTCRPNRSMERGELCTHDLLTRISRPTTTAIVTDHNDEERGSSRDSAAYRELLRSFPLLGSSPGMHRHHHHRHHHHHASSLERERDRAFPISLRFSNHIPQRVRAQSTTQSFRERNSIYLCSRERFCTPLYIP